MCYSGKTQTEELGSSSPNNYGTVQSSQDYTPTPVTSMGGPRRSNDQRASRNSSPVTAEQVSSDAMRGSRGARGMTRRSLFHALF